MNAIRKTVVLHDVDGRIPNLALLKLSTFHRQQGWHVVLSRARDGARPAARLNADKHLASVVFRTPVAARAVEQLQALYGDRNLLAYPGVEDLLGEMIARRYAINFSQTLDIAYLDEARFRLLCQVDSRNARFTKRLIYFSLNHPRDIRQFEKRAELLKGFGRHGVAVIMLYGFDTSLSEDYERFRFIRRKGYIPFFQQYWPIAGVADRVPDDYFDMDLNAMIRLTFHSNGQNWEKYLRWINTRYFQRYGRYYQPLIEILYRYNNRHRLEWFRMNPACMSDDLYRDHRDSLAELHATLRQQSLGPRPPRGLSRWLAQAAPDST